MSIPLTRPGKNSLIVETPVMPAAGVFGFGEQYRDLVDLDKLGAIVTNPVTYAPWSPATGTRVVPLDAGVLVHTGLPNPGLSKVLTQHRATWEEARAIVPSEEAGEIERHAAAIPHLLQAAATIEPRR